MGATLEGLAIRLNLDFLGLGRRVTLGNVPGFSTTTTDFTTIVDGDIRCQVNVHTKRWIKGTRNPSFAGRIQVVNLRLDFWQRLTDDAEEEDVMGSVVPGTAQTDFDLYGDPAFWRDVWPSDPALIWGILGIDLEQGVPEFFVERVGMIVHWQIIVGLRLVP